MRPVGAEVVAQDSDLDQVEGAPVRRLSVLAVAGAEEPTAAGACGKRAKPRLAAVVGAEAALEEELARVQVEPAMAQAALAEEVARPGLAGAAQKRAAAVLVEVGRAAEAPVAEAEEAASAALAVVSAAGQGNPVNGWRLRPCCAALGWARSGEQEALAPP